MHKTKLRVRRCSTLALLGSPGDLWTRCDQYGAAAQHGEAWRRRCPTQLMYRCSAAATKLVTVTCIMSGALHAAS